MRKGISMKICKLCERRFYNYYADKVLLICAIVSAILGIIFRFIINNENLFQWFVVLALTFGYIPVMYFLSKLYDGYILEEDGIYYRHLFKNNKLFFKEIKCIIFTNAMMNLTITKGVWVAIIGGEQTELLQYFNSFKRHVLSDYDIRSKLGAEIGYYHPGNVWEMFRKGSASIRNYGFIWNKREMHKILEGFKGNYYIAASVISNYNSEFNDIVKQYDIAGERIHIIDDSTNGKFIWR